MAKAYQFDRFLLYPESRSLWHDSVAVHIGGRALDLLIPLVAAAGKPVSKEALMEAAWPGRIVEPNNLTVQIAMIRNILQKTSGEKSGFIRTLARQGYIFTRPVEHTEVVQPATAAPQAEFAARLPVGIEPSSSFIGRETDLSEVSNLLSGKPLVSIVGIGGIGKTRLALQLGRKLAARYADGVAFVDLAPLSDPTGVADAVANAVGASGSTRTATEALLAALQTRRILLILDNAEHLREAVAALAQVILERAPAVAVLVTSRESLGLPGEQLFRLQPLSLPAPGVGITSAEALRYDAVKLFADRAVSLLPEFELEDENTADVVAICRRLDGIALALEMAVPRLQVLTPRQLSERLEDRFRPLAAGPRHALTRQRTLRTMFDWSWRLLQPAERMLLERLAVFTGSASLSALARLEDTEETEWDVLDVLTQLAQKSLLLFQPPSNNVADPRYYLLETTRQYVLEQLDPSRLSTLRRLHADCIARIFERAAIEWPTMHGVQWLNEYGPEVDNLRAALEWAFRCGGYAAEEGDDAIGLRLVAASGSLWRDLPSLPLRESQRWHAMAVSRIAPDTPLATCAWLRLGLSWKDIRKGDQENYNEAAEALALFRRTDDRLGLGAALWRLATTVMNDPVRAKPLLDEAEQLLRGLPPTKWHALCLIRRADLAKDADRNQESQLLYERALTMVRSFGYDYGLMLCGGNRAELLYDLGRGAEAIAEFRVLRHELPLGTRAPVVALMTWHLAVAQETKEAEDVIREIVAGFSVTGLRAALGRALEALALLRARAGDFVMAGRLLGCGQAFHPPTRPRGPRHVVIHQTKELVAAGLTVADCAALMAEGAAWSEDDAVAAALKALGT